MIYIDNKKLIHIKLHCICVCVTNLLGWEGGWRRRGTGEERRIRKGGKEEEWMWKGEEDKRGRKRRKVEVEKGRGRG